MAVPAGHSAATPAQLFDGYRSMLTPFLIKTYQLVDDPSLDDIVSWNEDGSAFVVWQPAEFGRDVLPQYFKHSNFSSFVRQLNTYGFRKIVADRWEFANEFFRRGEKKLLSDIQRKKISTSPPAPIPTAVTANCGGSSVSSSDNQILSPSFSYAAKPPTVWPGSWSGTTKLAEENERLRRENMKLSRELGQMRGLCDSILNLMSKYVSGQEVGDVVDAGRGGRTLSSSPPLGLVPMNLSQPEEAGAAAAEGSGATGSGPESPRLFGVSIGLKRSRSEDGDAASRSTSESKSEASDQAWTTWRMTLGGSYCPAGGRARGSAVGARDQRCR